MSFEQLKQTVWQANVALGKSGLVLFTWGNVSGIDPEQGVMAIKPSGVAYDALQPEHIVVLSMETGEVVEGDRRPSSDTPTHLEIGRAFEGVGGIVHTHSPYATSWAQARREIPCLGTTHADYFYGPVPVTRPLTVEEIQEDYERNTGRVIVERFVEGRLDPHEVAAILVPYHGVFCWGKTPLEALENALVVEEVAKMALFTRLLAPDAPPCPQVLLDKHFLRKHGPGAYYGQR